MAVTLATPTRAPHLTRAAGRAAGLLHAWHLLSLDAPTVAVLWTAFFTHAHHRSLPSSELVALFLFVWLLYVADRLLDAWRSSGKAQSRSSRATVSASLMPRHRFHLKHRRAFLAVAILAAAMLVPLTWRLPAPDLRLDLSLAAALVFWFLLIHLVASGRAMPKELTTGVFFAAATLIPTFTRSPAGSLPSAATLAAEAILFAALCTLNGLLITCWESGSAAGPQPERALRGATLVLVAVSAAFALLTWSPVPFAIALAAAALFLLGRIRRELHPTTLRAAADLALLTPILLWPGWLSCLSCFSWLSAR